MKGFGYLFHTALLSVVLLALSACEGTSTYAPVVDIASGPIPAKDTFSEGFRIEAKWFWPAQGKIISTFSTFNKGVNIAGYPGTPIYAAQPGKVVYCGNGLRGYGNLIIIRHKNFYLSAYAHNQRILVNEGDWVKKGQKIALMGNTGTDKVMLHFEIRRAGKPIDPISLYR